MVNYPVVCGCVITFPVESSALGMGNCILTDNFVTASAQLGSHLKSLCHFFEYEQVLFDSDDMKLFLFARDFLELLKNSK
jgi:hypothetical protein